MSSCPLALHSAETLSFRFILVSFLFVTPRLLFFAFPFFSFLFLSSLCFSFLFLSFLFFSFLLAWNSPRFHHTTAGRSSVRPSAASCMCGYPRRKPGGRGAPRNGAADAHGVRRSGCILLPCVQPLRGVSCRWRSCGWLRCVCCCTGWQVAGGRHFWLLRTISCCCCCCCCRGLRCICCCAGWRAARRADICRPPCTTSGGLVLRCCRRVTRLRFPHLHSLWSLRRRWQLCSIHLPP
jgi:hypothetical protein